MAEPLKITIVVEIPNDASVDLAVATVLAQCAERLRKFHPGIAKKHIARGARWLAESHEDGVTNA